jgi:hypothetical protein
MEFFIDLIFPVNSASNRNEYQKYFLGVKAAGTGCFEIWELQHPGTVSACIDIALLFIRYNIHHTEKHFKPNKTRCRFF